MPGTHIATIEEAEAWLAGLINLEKDPSNRRIRLGLGAIEALCESVGDPQRRFTSLHVAGSKGKGSVCRYAEAILAELGERVGTYTSPHLERWTERFRIDGVEVDGSALARVVEQLRPHVERLRAEDRGRAPSFFDATTAAGFLLFADAGVDRGVIEVGLGGRLDSTNVVRPAVTCVTSIELEHTDRLGHTHAEIAGEKAGILKPCVPCVAGPLSPEAMAVVEARAAACDAPLARVGPEISVRAWIDDAAGAAAPRLRFAMRDVAGFELEAELTELGEHQATNAAMAVACVRRLGPHSDEDVAEAASRALPRTDQPGRCELVRARPWIVIDGAHTPASAQALVSALDSLPAKRRHWVLSVSGGKALSEMLDAILPGAVSVVATRAEPHRSLEPEKLAELVRKHSKLGGARVSVEPDPDRALQRAAAALEPDELLCATGSVYLAGEARRVLVGREITASEA